MLACAGCEAFGVADPFDRVLGPKCMHRLEMTGEVDGTEVASDAYEGEALWFAEDHHHWELDTLAREAMEQLGLDSELPEDVARFHYFSNAFELRVINLERHGTELWSPVGRDLGIYFYDLERYDVQPGDEVAVFDISAIEALRTAGDRAALGAALRSLVDELRDNGQPDVIVGFSADRTQDDSLFLLSINLLAPSTRFANAGTARYFDLWSSGGERVRTVAYPVRSVRTISVEAEVLFGEDEVSISDRCRALEVVLRD